MASAMARVCAAVSTLKRERSHFNDGRGTSLPLAGFWARPWCRWAWVKTCPAVMRHLTMLRGDMPRSSAASFQAEKCLGST